MIVTNRYTSVVYTGLVYLSRGNILESERRALGRRIREAREAAGLTQDDVAERLNVAQKQISVWEAGISQPRPYQRLIDLARAIGVPVVQLLEGDERAKGQRGTKPDRERKA